MIENQPRALLPLDVLSSYPLQRSPGDIRVATTTLLLVVPTPIHGITLLCRHLLQLNVMPGGLSESCLKKVSDYWHSEGTMASIRKKDKIGTQYPVFFAVHKFFLAYKHATKSSQKLRYQMGCRVYLDTMARTGDDTITSSQYYNHARQLRDAIRTACSVLHVHADESADGYRYRIISHIRHLESDLSIDTDTIIELLDGSRIPGSVLRRVQPNKKSKRTTVKRKIGKKVAPGGIPFSRSEDIDPCNDDEPEQSYYQRQTGTKGSRQTRRDDQRILRYRTQAVGAYHNAAISDMHRITISTALDFLDYLLTNKANKAFICSLILLSTGCDATELEKLVIDHSPHKQGICFDLDSSTLCFPFRNGEIKTPNAQGRHIEQYMPLLLPSFITKLFHKNARDRVPFEGVTRSINDWGKKFGAQHSDENPTASRISNGFETIFAVTGFRHALEAAYISGDIPSKYATQACYYQFDVAHLNLAYQKAWKNFLDRALQQHSSEQLKESLNAWRQFDLSKLPDGKIGSQLYTERSPYLKLLHALRVRFNQLNRSFAREDPKSKMLHATELLSIQHLYFYLLTQITMALRPPGPATSLVIPESQHPAWSQTKNSKNYIERNLSVCLEAIQIQQQAIQANLKEFKRIASQYISISNIDNISTHLPIHFQFNADVPWLKTQRLTGARARTLMNKYISEFDIKLQLPVHANNIFRHINASLMYGSCPQPLLDEYMGHGKEGLYTMDPFSTTSLRSLPELEKHIARLGESIPKTPLHIQFVL